MHNAINYEKLKEVTQEKAENPHWFLAQLTETLRRYSDINSDSAEEQILLGLAFISYSAPDIHSKLHKQEIHPQTLLRELVILAFGVFNSQNIVKVQKRIKEGSYRQKSRLNFLQKSKIRYWPQLHKEYFLQRESSVKGNSRKQVDSSNLKGKCYECRRLVHWER
jgi:hypothetical protein